MLAVKNLERLIEIEADLKSQYQTKLDEKDVKIESAVKQQEELKATIEKLEATIAQQLDQIKTLSSNSSNAKRLEQQNRELTARATRLQEEVESQKKRNRTMQKDLAAEREELKALKQFDPKKMKKNLDASKKKQAEQQAANDLLQKTNNKLKKETAEYKKKVEELEAKVTEYESKNEEEKTDSEKAAATESSDS